MNYKFSEVKLARGIDPSPLGGCACDPGSIFFGCRCGRAQARGERGAEGMGTGKSASPSGGMNCGAGGKASQRAPEG